MNATANLWTSSFWFTGICDLHRNQKHEEETVIISNDTEKETITADSDTIQDATRQPDHSTIPFSPDDMYCLLTAYEAYESLNTISRKIVALMDDLARIGDLVNRFSSLYDENQPLCKQEHTMILKDPHIDRLEKARLLMSKKESSRS